MSSPRAAIQTNLGKNASAPRNHDDQSRLGWEGPIQQPGKGSVGNESSEDYLAHHPRTKIAIRDESSPTGTGTMGSHTSRCQCEIGCNNNGDVCLWYHEVNMPGGTLYLKRQSSHPSSPVVQANYSATGTSGGLVTGFGAKRRAIVER